MTLTLTLPRAESVYTGRQITFQSPCESEGLTGLIVQGVEYALVDALGHPLVGNSFDAGAMVSVIFNVEKQSAYVQNASTTAYIEQSFLKKSNVDGGNWNVDMEGHRLTGLPLPESGSDPATKEFVENFTVERSTYVATDDNKDGNIVLRPYVADADELEFRDHINNTNNPHKVSSLHSIGTSAGTEKYIQLGVARFTANWSRAHATFILSNAYAGVSHASIVSARVFYGSGVATVSFEQIAGKDITHRLFYYTDSNLDVYFYYLKLNNEELVAHTLDVEGFMEARYAELSSLATYTGTAKYELGASAPSGYGLGEHIAMIVRDVNNATRRGWFLAEPGATNSPNSTYYVAVRSDGVDGNSLVQTAYVLDSYFSKVVRRRIFGTWGAWEWVNPPMALGVEYRTTERCEGKAVYAKRINCYAAPASVDISDLGIDTVVRWNGWVSYYGVALPCSSTNWKVDINRNSIVTTSAYEQASAHFYIILYYTKS